MKFVVLLLTLCIYLISCLPPPHPEVEAVRREEELLPLSLRSPALHNPNLQEVLPLTSLLHNGEKLVFGRDTNNVTREEIYNILTHAGLIPRKKFLHPMKKVQQPLFSQHQEFYQPSFYDPPHFPTQDFLQYL